MSDLDRAGARKVIINLGRLLRFCREIAPRLTAAYYATAALTALVPLLSSLTLAWLVDALVVRSGTPAPGLPLILVVILAARYAVTLADNVFYWALNLFYVDYLFRARIQNGLALRFAAKISSLDVARFEDPPTLDRITKARENVLWRPPEFLRMLSICFGQAVAFVSAFIVLLPLGWWIPAAVTVSALPRLYARLSRGRMEWSIWASGVPGVRRLWYYHHLLSDPAAVRETRILGARDGLLDRFRKTQDENFDLRRAPLNRHLPLLVLPPILEAAVLVGIAVLFLSDVLAGALSIGAYTLLVNMIDRLSGSAVTTASTFGGMYEHALFVDDVFDVLALPRIIRSPERPVSISTGGRPPMIEFRDVSFRYPNGPEVLHRVSFTIEPGEHVALVGANGAGKTTIVKLLCRFYDVDSGSILIGGTDIRNIDLASWYQSLGTLFQDFVHFSLPAREAISLGMPGPIDDRRAEEAARRSGAWSFIEEWPERLGQQLGRQFEGGVEPSAGQWQKLALARAFYAEPPVLILDEPTSAVDAEAEREIFENLDATYRDKSVLFVSHRFSSVRRARSILVIESGRIVERGAHEELLAAGGRYASMFTAQAEGYR